MNLNVSNLSCNTKESDLIQHFEQIGKVLGVQLLPITYVDNDSANIKTYLSAIIVMENKEAALKSVQMLNNTLLNKRIIGVSISLNQEMTYKLSESSLNKNINESLKWDIRYAIDTKILFNYEKALMLNKILINYKEASNYQMQAFFSIEIQQIIKNGLKSLESEIELILLDIIETVVERGTQMNMIANRGYFEQIFYQSLVKSKLLEKIKSLLQSQFQKDKQKFNSQFSYLTEQLIRIYLFAQKQQRIEYSMIDICVEAITSNILKSFEFIKKIANDQFEKQKRTEIKDNCSDDEEEQDVIFDIEYKNIQIRKKHQHSNENQNNQQKEQHQQMKEDFNNQIKSTILLIKALQCIISSNFNYLINDVQFHEKISPVIHMNCHQSLNCIHAINVQLTPDLYTLQSLIFEILRELSSNNNVQQYLLSQHSIHSHIVSIIQYSSYYQQIHSNQIIQQQNQISPNSQLPDIISTSIKFFNDFLISSSSNIKSSFSQPGFISLIIKILNNKQFNVDNKSIIENNFNIKEKILKYLKGINIDNIESQQVLIDSNYIGALSQLIGIAGGNEIQQNQKIEQYISNINHFITNIRIERNEDEHNQFKTASNSNIFSDSEEQIEQEGGLEEIESMLYSNQNVQQNFYSSKNLILKCYDDHSNFDMKLIDQKPNIVKRNQIEQYIFSQLKNEDNNLVIQVVEIIMQMNLHKLELIVQSKQLLKQTINDAIMILLPIVQQFMNIFASDKRSDKYKKQQLIKIHHQYQKLNSNDLKMNFCLLIQQIITSNLGRCETDLQQYLLDIIETIALRGSEITIAQQNILGKFVFFQGMVTSGLFEKIRILLIQKINIERQNTIKIFSNQTEQLTRIYLMIMNGEYINYDMFYLISEVISTNINNNIEIMTNNQINNDEERIDINITIQQTINLIWALKYAIPSNLQNFINILKIHHKIAPLIHMNCHQSLNCIHAINVQLTPDLYTLQSLIYEILSELSSNNNNVQQYLLSQHSIHSHIVSIIQYSSYYQQIHSNQIIQQSKYQYPNSQIPNLISTSIKFFNDFLISSSSNIKSSFSSPGFISMIIKILNNNQFDNNYETNFNIKQKILKYLNRISIDNIESQQVLIDSNYIGAISQLIGNACGNENETTQYVYQRIQNIEYFLSNVQHEIEKEECQQLIPLTLFIKTSIEQIEFEGGLEEIESQVFSKIMGNKQSSVKIKKMISKRFDDHSDFDMKQIDEKPDDVKRSFIQNFIRIHSIGKEIGLSDMITTSIMKQNLPQLTQLVQSKQLLSQQITQTVKFLLSFAHFIENVFKSVEHSYDQKIESLIQLHSQIKNIDQQQLQIYFNQSAQLVINKLLGFCNTPLQCTLLDIVETFVERMSRNSVDDKWINPLLQQNIQFLINQKILDNQQEQRINIIEQLCRIYMFIMKQQIIDQKMVKILTDVISKNIDNLLQVVKDEQIVNNKNKTDINLISSQTINLITSLKCVISKNKDQFFSNFGIHKILIPLFHFNCHYSLNCHHSINIQPTPTLLELQSTILFFIGELSTFYNLTEKGKMFNIKDLTYQFLKLHSITAHLTTIIITFTSQNTQFNHKFNQQQFKQSQLVLIAEAIKLLNIQFNKNPEFIYVALSSPQLIPSILILLNYKQDLFNNIEIDNVIMQIRENSHMSISKIQLYGDDQVYCKLQSSNYIGSIIQYIGTAGGSENERNEQIYESILNIKDFVNSIKNGRNDIFFPKLIPTPSLIKPVQEQIEESGGLEEIESQILINNTTKINMISNEIKEFILNQCQFLSLPQFEKDNYFRKVLLGEIAMIDEPNAQQIMWLMHTQKDFILDVYIKDDSLLFDEIVKTQKILRETTNKLFVYNLNIQTNAISLQRLFGNIGPVKKVKIIQNNAISLCCGFVDMKDEQMVQRAQQQLNGKDLDGNNIRIEVVHFKSQQLNHALIQSHESNALQFDQQYCSQLSQIEQKQYLKNLLKQKILLIDKLNAEQIASILMERDNNELIQILQYEYLINQNVHEVQQQLLEAGLLMFF